MHHLYTPAPAQPGSPMRTTGGGEGSMRKSRRNSFSDMAGSFNKKKSQFDV